MISSDFFQGQVQQSTQLALSFLIRASSRPEMLCSRWVPRLSLSLRRDSGSDPSNEAQKCGSHLQLRTSVRKKKKKFDFGHAYVGPITSWHLSSDASGSSAISQELCRLRPFSPARILHRSFEQRTSLRQKEMPFSVEAEFFQAKRTLHIVWVKQNIAELELIRRGRIPVDHGGTLTSRQLAPVSRGRQ